MWKGFQKRSVLRPSWNRSPKVRAVFRAAFERGWGTTVGNALRRALLSSIEGAAITAVKIEGVLHEFSSIPGVVEDATDIILNLKQVPIKLNTDLPKTIFVNVEQAGPVTSRKSRKTRTSPSSIRACTSPPSARRQAADRNARQERPRLRRRRPHYDEDLPIGYIPVDSVHSPWRKVNYAVEAARLGQMTDYEKLMMKCGPTARLRRRTPSASLQTREMIT